MKEPKFVAQAIEIDTIYDWLKDCHFLKARLYVGQLLGREIKIRKIAKMKRFEEIDTPSCVNGLLELVGEILADVKPDESYVRFNGVLYKKAFGGRLVVVAEEVLANKQVVSEAAAYEEVQ